MNQLWKYDINSEQFQLNLLTSIFRIVKEYIRMNKSMFYDMTYEYNKAFIYKSLLEYRYIVENIISNHITGE